MSPKSPGTASFVMQFSTSVCARLLSVQAVSSRLTQNFSTALSFCILLHCLKKEGQILLLV